MMGIQDEWPNHTFMDKDTIKGMLERNDIDMNWAAVLGCNLAYRTEYRTREGAVLYAVFGGIGRFMEDCIIMLAVLALQKPTAYEQEQQRERVRKQWL